MKAQRKKRLYLIITLLIGVSAAVSLAVYALGQNINLYLTPSQVVAGQAPVARVFRLGGMVKPGSFKRFPHTLQTQFMLTDYQHDVAVDYSGILPALFREGQGVVVQGKLMATGRFNAEQVLAKHDEKYMPPGLKK